MTPTDFKALVVICIFLFLAMGTCAVYDLQTLQIERDCPQEGTE